MSTATLRRPWLTARNTAPLRRWLQLVCDGAERLLGASLAL